MSTGSDALHAIFSGLVCRSLSNRGPHGMEVDSQTDGLLLNVSLPLPTLPDILLKEMASDETWETAVGGGVALSYYVEGCIDHVSPDGGPTQPVGP